MEQETHPKNKIFLKCCLSQFLSSITYDVLISLNKSILLNNKSISTQKLAFLYAIYNLPNTILPLVLGKLNNILIKKYNKHPIEINQIISVCLYSQTVSSSLLFFLGVYYQSFYLLCLSRLILGVTENLSILQNKIISEFSCDRFYGLYTSIFYGSGKLGSALLFYKSESLEANHGKYFICTLGIFSSFFGLLVEVFGYFLLYSCYIRGKKRDNRDIVVYKNKEFAPVLSTTSINKSYLLNIELDNLNPEGVPKLSLLKIIYFKIQSIRNYFASLIFKNKIQNVSSNETKTVSKIIVRSFLILLSFTFIISSSSSFSNMSPLIFKSRYKTKNLNITTRELALMELTSIFISIVLNLFLAAFDYRIYLILTGLSILVLSHLLILNSESLKYLNNPKIISIFLGVANPLISCYSALFIKCIAPGLNRDEVISKVFEIVSCVSSIGFLLTPIFIGNLSKNDTNFFHTEVFFFVISIICFIIIIVYRFTLY
ncbi:hypothetical protein CDIK_0882 [Cucumispora dikerogammari]|nr:hypothetical protein CDIK_0882 [Cucumispora dikerogammari]